MTSKNPSDEVESTLSKSESESKTWTLFRLGYWSHSYRLVAATSIHATQ